jgi:photosystem II stability/assembly factor-like uncharacterized protein
MTIVCLSPNGVDQYRLEGPPDTVFVATLTGVVRLDRRSASAWSASRVGLDGIHIEALMREPRGGALFAGTHGSGLQRSLDNGDSWERASAGIPHADIFTLAYAETKNRIALYAGTEPAHLYRSTDNGNHWSELVGMQAVPTRDKWNFPAPPHIAHVKHVTVDPRDERTIYVCIEQGALLKSTDDGKTFHELHFQDETYKLNKDTHRIVFNPRNADEIYVDGGDGIARSYDAGQTWTRLATPTMRVAYPDHLYYSPEQQGVLYVAGGGTPPNIWRQTGNAQAAIARSTDNGRTWTALGGGLPEHIAGNIEAVSMAAWPGGFGFVAGTSDGQVFASFDRGERWQEIATVAPVTKCVHHRNLEMGRAKVREAAAAAH